MHGRGAPQSPFLAPRAVIGRPLFLSGLQRTSQMPGGGGGICPGAGGGSFAIDISGPV